MLNIAPVKSSSRVAMAMTSSWCWVPATVGWRSVGVWRESRDLSPCCKIRDTWDVLSALCSGKSECSLRVNDQTFNNIKPCYDNLKMYLLTAYICVNGTINCLLAVNIRKVMHIGFLLDIRHRSNVLDRFSVRRALNTAINNIYWIAILNVPTFCTLTELHGLAYMMKNVHNYKLSVTKWLYMLHCRKPWLKPWNQNHEISQCWLHKEGKGFTASASSRNNPSGILKDRRSYYVLSFYAIYWLVLTLVYCFHTSHSVCATAFCPLFKYEYDDDDDDENLWCVQCNVLPLVLK